MKLSVVRLFCLFRRLKRAKQVRGTQLTCSFHTSPSWSYRTMISQFAYGRWMKRTVLLPRADLLMWGTPVIAAHTPAWIYRQSPALWTTVFYEIITYRPILLYLDKNWIQSGDELTLRFQMSLTKSRLESKIQTINPESWERLSEGNLTLSLCLCRCVSLCL